MYKVGEVVDYDGRNFRIVYVNNYDSDHYLVSLSDPMCHTKILSKTCVCPVKFPDGFFVRHDDLIFLFKHLS